MYIVWRRWLALVLACLMAASAVAQEVSLFNRFGSTFLSQEADEDASPDFGNLYNWVVGGYEDEKFSFYGRLQLTLEAGESGWKDGATFGVGTNNPKTETRFMEFSGAFRPLPFLELALGNGYGTNDRMELPWEDYQLPGGYGYATESSYGLRKWAGGNGLSVLFRGDGAGVEGLTVGWNALPLGSLMAEGKGAWETTLAANYLLGGVANIGLGARLNIAEDAGQVVGVYGELLAVRGLKVNAGATMYTGSTDTVLGSADAMAMYGKTFATVVNAGLQYTVSPLRMTVGADMGILAGRQKLTGQYARHNATAMPLLVGGIIRWTIIPPVHARIQVKYGDNLASREAARESRVTVNPRISYNAGRIGTFCLDPVIEIVRKNTESFTGYRMGLYWQCNFGGVSTGRRPRS